MHQQERTDKTMRSVNFNACYIYNITGQRTHENVAGLACVSPFPTYPIIMIVSETEGRLAASPTATHQTTFSVCQLVFVVVISSACPYLHCICAITCCTAFTKLGFVMWIIISRMLHSESTHRM